MNDCYVWRFGLEDMDACTQLVEVVSPGYLYITLRVELCVNRVSVHCCVYAPLVTLSGFDVRI